jgi:hypothetical protein
LNEAPILSKKYGPFFSTYGSIAEISTDAVHPTRNDYIIHALGDECHNDYINELRNHKGLVCTLRHSYTHWEDWIQHRNADFYEILLHKFSPFKYWDHALVWREGSPADRVWSSDVSEVEKKSDSATVVRVFTPGSTGGDREIVYSFLTIKYHCSSDSPFSSFLCLPKLFVRSTDSGGSIGLPAICPADGVRLMARRFRGDSAYFMIHSYPSESSKFTIDSVENINSVRLLDGSDPISVKTSIVSENFSDSNWINGISVMSESTISAYISLNPTPLAAFFFRDPNIPLPKVGDLIKFKKSGIRYVLCVSSDQIFVDGPPLDPISDGYPHEIIISSR